MTIMHISMWGQIPGEVRRWASVGGGARSGGSGGDLKCADCHGDCASSVPHTNKHRAGVKVFQAKIRAHITDLGTDPQLLAPPAGSGPQVASSANAGDMPLQSCRNCNWDPGISCRCPTGKLHGAYASIQDQRFPPCHLSFLG